MPTTPATAANTIAATIPYLSAITAAVTNFSRTTPAVANQIQSAMAGVQQGVQALADSETAVQSKPIVDRIGADAQAVLSVAASLPLPPPFNIILMVASSLVPTVLSGVHLLIANRATVTAAVPATAPAITATVAP